MQISNPLQILNYSYNQNEETVVVNDDKFAQSILQYKMQLTLEFKIKINQKYSQITTITHGNLDIYSKVFAMILQDHNINSESFLNFSQSSDNFQKTIHLPHFKSICNEDKKIKTSQSIIRHQYSFSDFQTISSSMSPEFPPFQGDNDNCSNKSLHFIINDQKTFQLKQEILLDSLFLPADYPLSRIIFKPNQ